MSKVNAPCAWIACPRDRGRRPIKNGKVYLKDGEEFEIEIFNPLQNTVKAEIYINGNSATNGGLVIRPGKRQYLDCFTSTRKKFTFNTYSVDNDIESKKAIEKNGLVEVFFYKEKSISYWPNKYYDWSYYYQPCHWNSPTTTIYGSGGTNTITGESSGGISSSDLNGSISIGSTGVFYSSCSIETGRVEGGSSSSQQFHNVDMDFELFCISQISYQILPESTKPIEVSELRKKFCTDCGRKLKDSFKFCPDCGELV